MEEEEEEEEEVVDGFVAKCLGVIDEITALTDENDGHNLSDIFIKLPSRKLYPDYYLIIKKPVSINQVKKQLNQDKFASFEEFIAELKQMCLNAKTYNEEGSFVYTDATVIEKLLDGKLAEGDEARINV